MSNKFPPMDKVDYEYSQQPPLRHPNMPEMKYSVPPSQSMYFQYAQGPPGSVPPGQATGSGLYSRGDPYSYHRPPPPHFGYDPRYVVDGAPRGQLEYRGMPPRESMGSVEGEYYGARAAPFTPEGPSGSPSNPWSQIEINILHTAVTSYATLERPNPTGFVDPDTLSWEKIASHLPNRSPDDCRMRWEKRNIGMVVRPPGLEMRAPPMVFAEGNKLKRSSVEIDEIEDDKSDRKKQRLNKMKKKAPWTKEEEEIINKMQTELGNKWTIIANKLTNRSSNDVKNYWYSKQRSIMKRTRLPGEVGADDDGDDEGISETKETEKDNEDDEHSQPAVEPKKDASPSKNSQD